MVLKPRETRLRCNAVSPPHHSKEQSVIGIQYDDALLQTVKVYALDHECSPQVTQVTSSCLAETVQCLTHDYYFTTSSSSPISHTSDVL